MPRAAAVLCQDPATLRTLKTALDQLEVELLPCRSEQDTMDKVLSGSCTAVIIDFDLPDAAEIAKVTGLLPPQQKPLVLGVTGPWPGTGQAFQSGVNRILYKPLDLTQIKDAVETSREFKKGEKKNEVRKSKASKDKDKDKGSKDHRISPRYDIKTVVHLDFANGTVAAIGLNISEHGFAVQATAPIPTCTNLPFRCVLPNTGHSLNGFVDVIWADGEGRAGLFFSHVAPAARRRLRHWLHTFGPLQKGAVRALLPPPNASVGITAAAKAR